MVKDVQRLVSPLDSQQAAPEDEIDLRGIVRALWRRKWILFFTVVLITGMAMAYVSQLTPLYQGEALVRVETSDTASTLNVQTAQDLLVATPQTLDSEVEFIKSFAFARTVVREAGLERDAEFNVDLRPKEQSIKDLLDPRAYLPEEWLEYVQFGDDKEERVEKLLEAQEDPKVVVERNVARAFLSRMNAEKVGRSYVIEIKVLSEDPFKAAKIANVTANLYTVAQLERKYESAEKATAYLKDRVEQLRSKVEQSEQAIAEYRRQNRLSTGERSNPVILQLTQLNNQLALASAERAGAEARLQQVDGLLNSQGGISAAAKVLSSPLLDTMRAQETDMLRELAEVSQIYGPRHPQYVNAQSDLRTLRNKMDDEVQRISQDLRNEVSVTRAREAEIQSNLRGLEGQVSDQQVAEVGLRSMIQEADANQELFETFLRRYNEIVEQLEIQEADVQVLSEAEPAQNPAYPNKRLFIAVALAGSLILGIMLVFLVERWDSDYGFRSADEVMNATGLRALALIPDLAKRETEGQPAEEYILRKPNSAFSESLQRVRTALLQVPEGEEAPKSLLITSSVPLEGKSLVSCSLARQSARSGLRTLLVDGDLRRPRLHEVIRVPNQNGLSDVLSGRILVDEAIRQDEKSGMHFMPSGMGASSPPDLFRSSAMDHMLEDLKDRYDLIVFDTPPVAAVSDSFALSTKVDRTIYVVRWEATARNVATHGMQTLVESGANLAGVVLSRVNVKKHSKYGYADSGYYSGYYRKYYVN